MIQIKSRRPFFRYTHHEVQHMNKIYFIIKLLALAGITLALYLIWQQQTQAASSICSINEQINCNALIFGPLAKTFGIPTPLYGLIGYVCILVSSIFHKKRLIFFFATAGLLFCAWIAYQEIVTLRVICPICIACQSIMLFTFMLSVYLLRNFHPVASLNSRS